MAMPLEGVRILDWTVMQAGGAATALLGDFGAEVIKIEERTSGDRARWIKELLGHSGELRDGRRAGFEFYATNKKGVALDLKKPGGKEIVYKLVKKSDVFVQNFRPGVAARLGVDYATLSQHNSKLIYANVSPYGPRGPEYQEPGNDYLAGARSGFMAMAAGPGEAPRRVEGAIHDQTTATVLACGILAALFTRERQGIGQELHVSLLGSNIWLQGLFLSYYLMAGDDLRQGSREKALNPLFNHYRCKDGKYIALGGFQSDRYWPIIIDALDLRDLVGDTRFDSAENRAKNCEELVGILDDAFATKTCTEWLQILRRGGDFLCTPVQGVSDLAADPQVIENNYIIEFDHPALGKVKQLGIPVEFSKTPARRRLPAPQLGEHTEEVLIEIGGYTWEEIGKLKDQEVI